MSRFSASTATVRDIKMHFLESTIKTKVVQNVAIDILVEGQGVRRAAELLHDAVQAGSREKSIE